jgi:hypothetical protein
MSPGAQNIKTGPDVLGIAENESGRENMKTGPHASVPQKTRTGAQNMKTGTESHDTAENESELANYENETRRPRYRRKRVCARKT